MAARIEATPEVAREIPTVSPEVDVEGGPATRLCGRCRKSFGREVSDPPAAQVPWWLCPPCHKALIGGTARGHRTP